MNTNPILDTLNNWIAKQVLITKHEIDDYDETVLTLGDAIFKEQNNDMEHYLSPTILQLRGDGFVRNEHKDEALPYGSYDIALEDLTDVEITGNLITFHTSRGHYRITLIQ